MFYKRPHAINVTLTTSTYERSSRCIYNIHTYRQVLNSGLHLLLLIILVITQMIIHVV